MLLLSEILYRVNSKTLFEANLQKLLYTVIMLYIKANFKDPDTHVAEFEKERDSYLHILDPTLFKEAKQFYGSALDPNNPDWVKNYQEIMEWTKRVDAARAKARQKEQNNQPE